MTAINVAWYSMGSERVATLRALATRPLPCAGSGLFNYGGFMNYDKPYKSLDEQLELLAHRGLIIDNTQYAKKLLLTNSYYDLINGYKDIFMPNDIFISPINLETISIFNYINKSVQATIMKYALIVETKFKSTLSYIMAKNIGVHQDIYLQQKHYKLHVYRNLTFEQVKSEINRQLILEKAKHPTKHYLKRHNHVPPWILLKNLSLGTSINLFKALRAEYRNEVTNLLIPSEELTMSQKTALILYMLDGIRLFRNKIAHNLNFIKCRTKYNLPYESLCTLLPVGVIKRDKAKVSKSDKISLRGIFGVLLSMYALIDDNMLCKNMLLEFSSHFTIDKYSKSLIKKYQTSTNLPEDFIDRFYILLETT